MKILLITDHHSPQGGGAEKQFFTLKELLKKQTNLTVYSLGFSSQKVQGDDFIVLKETSSKILRQIWRMFINPIKYLQLRQCIKKINPDVIHLHNIKKYTPTLLKAIQDYPAIQTVHDFSLICPTQWNIHKNGQPCKTGFSLHCFWQHRREYGTLAYLALVFSFLRMRRLVKKSVHHFIAPSPVLAHYLEKQQFQKTQFIFPFLSENSSINQKKSQQGHFLYLGQLEQQKGIHFLLDEFYLAMQKNNFLRLTIAGRGSQKNNLKEKIKRWHLEDKVRLIDWCNDPKELYEQCCAVIFPSIGLESFGLVITEAMAHARPVIGSNRGPTAWLVEHEKTGLLFDPLLKGDLAAKMLELSYYPLTLLHALGKNAAEKFSTFSHNVDTLKEIIAIYSASR